jgi:hypothetical protein
MPIQPHDRFQQDTERAWRGRTVAGHFPAQAPYRGYRTSVGTLSWHKLNNLPAGSVRRHLNPR